MNSLLHNTDNASDFKLVSPKLLLSSQPGDDDNDNDELVMKNSSDILAPLSLHKLHDHEDYPHFPICNSNDSTNCINNLMANANDKTSSSFMASLDTANLMMLSQLSINENSDDEEPETDYHCDTASDEFPVSCHNYQHTMSSESYESSSFENDAVSIESRGADIAVTLGSTHEEDNATDSAILRLGEGGGGRRRSSRCIEKIVIGRDGKAKNEQLMHFSDKQNNRSDSAAIYLSDTSSNKEETKATNVNVSNDNPNRSYLCKAVHENVLEKVNFGDDVAFVFKPTNDVDIDSKKWYFGLADGVSANRLRGYDAKLFPNALIQACANFLLMDTLSVSLKADTSHQKQQSSKPSSPTNSDLLLRQRVVKSESKTGINHINHLSEEDSSIHPASSSNLVPSSLLNRSFSKLLGGGQIDAGQSQEENDRCKDLMEFFEKFKENINLEQTLLDAIADNDPEPDASMQQQQLQINECKKLFNVLSDAHNFVLDKNVFGSSTICLLSLTLMNDQLLNVECANSNDDNKSMCALLTTCNLGDSGYIIIRDRKVKYKSVSQSHRYNAPYQLGCTPPELLDHDLYRDKPEDALFSTHILFPEDFLIISSDGLFDNLYEDEIAELVYDHTSAFTVIDEEVLHSTSRLLVQKACKAEIKRDDILVITVHIQ